MITVERSHTEKRAKGLAAAVEQQQQLRDRLRMRRGCVGGWHACTSCMQSPAIGPIDRDQIVALGVSAARGRNFTLLYLLLQNLPKKKKKKNPRKLCSSIHIGFNI